MRQVRSLCVYCGSSTGLNPAYEDSARRLGRIMAEHRISLIYGGGRVGLMGVLADAVLAGGGDVVGIIPEFLKRIEVGHGGVDELVVVDTMHTRKHRMFELADAFVILPGGLGTLDETFEILTWRQLHLHDRPIVLVNVEGYWNPFLDLVDRVVAHGFAREVRKLFTTIGDVEELLPLLASEPEPAIREAAELI